MAEQANEKTVPPNPLAGEYRAIEGAYRRDVTILEAAPKIKQWGIILWGMADVILLIIFVATVPVYIISGSFADSRQAAGMLANSGNTHALVLAQAAESLEVGNAKALAGDTGTTDFLADATNPNSEWYVTFSYAFSYDGGETEPVISFLNPGESRPLTVLHVKTDSLAKNPQIVLRDIVWHRVNRHLIADTAAFLTNHNEFPVSNIVSAADIVIGKSAVARTDFTVENRTAYSYWEPKFIIQLVRGGNPVAIQEVTVSSFMAGESRPVSVRWFQPVPAGAGVKITPAINFFDDGVYMNPLGE
ncbi:MAG: hypothetical protein WC813_03220 [Patescibacteria group bacterium]|jgi:hypothetical protein